jgi:hypothetical protein
MLALVPLERVGHSTNQTERALHGALAAWGVITGIHEHGVRNPFMTISNDMITIP